MIETIAPLNCLGPCRLDEMEQGLASSPKKNLLLRLRQNLQPQHLSIKSSLARQVLHIERSFCQVNLAIVGVGHRSLLLVLICCNILYYIIIHSFSKEARKTTRQKTLLRKLRRELSVNSLYEKYSLFHNVSAIFSKFKKLLFKISLSITNCFL